MSEEVSQSPVTLELEETEESKKESWHEAKKVPQGAATDLSGDAHFIMGKSWRSFDPNIAVWCKTPSLSWTAQGL